MTTRVAFTLCLLYTNVLYAQVSEKEANKIASQINALFSDYTDTTIIGTNGNDGVIVLSGKILSDKKGLWVFISALAVGKHLNDNPSVKLDEIWFADVGEMKSKPLKCSTLPADVAKMVQTKVSSDKIELEEGIKIIASNLKIKSITK